MTARQDTRDIMTAAAARGLTLSFDDANTLRRAEKTLHSWAELECGDGNDYASWAIERDENGEGVPYLVQHHYAHGAGKDSVTRTRIPDREAGALKRISELCKRTGAHFYHQTDPRGCALYVSAEPIDSNNYTRGVACCS